MSPSLDLPPLYSDEELSGLRAEVSRLRRESGSFTGCHSVYRGKVTDCFSLVFHLTKFLGNPFPAWPGVAIPPGFWRDRKFSVQGQYDFFHVFLTKHWNFYPKALAKRGDVVGFELFGRVVHLAMCLDDEMNLLAVFDEKSGASIVSRFDKSLYRNGYRGTYRPGVWA